MKHLLSRLSPRTSLVLATALVGVLGVGGVAVTASGPASARAVHHTHSSAAAGLATVCLASSLAPDAGTTIKVPTALVAPLLRTTKSYTGPCAQYGESATLGDGSYRVFSQTEGHKPLVIGLIGTDKLYQTVPTGEPYTDHLWCYDKNGDGQIEEMAEDGSMECSGGHERAMALNATFKKKVKTPFTYVLVNWNPMGHSMPIWNVPHFDVHFYMNSNAERLAIKPGPCWVLIDCALTDKASNLPAAKYIAPNYTNDLQAYEPGMGNHLVDSTSPELPSNGGDASLFTKTWMFGSWDGQITFYEPMVRKTIYDGLIDGTVADSCSAIPRPPAVQKTGWYPTKYCVRHRANRHETLTTMEDFVYRVAS